MLEIDIGYTCILIALDLYRSTICKCITLDDLFQPNINEMLMFLKDLILKNIKEKMLVLMPTKTIKKTK